MRADPDLRAMARRAVAALPPMTDAEISGAARVLDELRELHAARRLGRGPNGD